MTGNLYPKSWVRMFRLAFFVFAGGPEGPTVRAYLLPSLPFIGCVRIGACARVRVRVFAGMTYNEQDIDLNGQVNRYGILEAQLGTVDKLQGNGSSTPDIAVLSQQIQEVVHRCHSACSECLQLLCSRF